MECKRLMKGRIEKIKTRYNVPGSLHPNLMFYVAAVVWQLLRPGRQIFKKRRIGLKV